MVLRPFCLCLQACFAFIVLDRDLNLPQHLLTGVADNSKAGLVPSRSEARRAVEQGGVTVDGDKVTDFKKTYTKDEVANGLVVRRGKKAFKKVTL